MGAADTYQTIIDMVNMYWEDFNDEVRETCTKEEVARSAFDNALWTCVSTELDQMTY